MECFDLFHNLRERTVQLFSNADIHPAYTIDHGKFFTEELLSSAATNKTKILYINFNSDQYCDAREYKNKIDKNPPLRMSIIQKFISLIETNFQSSDSIRDVLSSSSFSVLVCAAMDTSDEPITLNKIIGCVMYSCSPCYGLIVPLLIVSDKFQNKHVGTTLLQCLQQYTYEKLHTKRVLVWLTHDKSNKSNTLCFYLNLGFNPAIASNFALGHTLPYVLLNDINDINAPEYLLECTNDICPRQKTTVSLKGEKNVLFVDINQARTLFVTTLFLVAEYQ